MWMLLSRRTQVIILVALTILSVMGLQGINQLLTGQTGSPLHYISTVVFIVGTLAVVLANYGWRAVWRRFPKLGHVFFPDLNGKWRGSLKTTWKDANGLSPGPIDTTIWIRQTLFTIHVHQRTKESESWSRYVIAEAHPEAGRFQLWYSYINRPKAEVNHRSAQHEGLAILQIVPEIEDGKITGHYYTSRQTSGDIEVSRCV